MKTKKITALILAFAMIFALLPTSVFADDASGNGWTVINNVVTVSTDEGMEEWIKERVKHNQHVTSAIIEEGVTTIGEQAFYSVDNLESVTIPASVTTISKEAFYDSEKLKNVTFAENSQLATIGESAFKNCISLESIEIPEGVTSIGDDAFYFCQSLTSIKFPKGVTSIGKWAFEFCSSLESVTFVENSQLNKIVDFAFYYCRNLKTIYIPCNFDKTLFTNRSGIILGENDTYKVYTNSPNKPTGTFVYTHDFGEWQKDENNHWHECPRENCGAKADEAAHIWDDGVVTTKPTYTAKGEKTFTCTECQATKTEEIPKLKRPAPPTTDPDEEIDQGITDDPTIDTVLPDGTVVPGNKPVNPSIPEGAVTNPKTGDSIFANLF